MADILTPTLGESVLEATIAKWTRKVGEAVKKDEVLVELETDKVSLEVVAPSDGVLGEIKFAEGDTVTPGAVLGSVTEGAAGAGATPAAAAPMSPESRSRRMRTSAASSCARARSITTCWNGASATRSTTSI